MLRELGHRLGFFGTKEPQVDGERSFRHPGILTPELAERINGVLGKIGDDVDIRTFYRARDINCRSWRQGAIDPNLPEAWREFVSLTDELETRERSAVVAAIQIVSRRGLSLGGLRELGIDEIKKLVSAGDLRAGFLKRAFQRR